MTVRVYVPATLGALERFVEEGGIGPSPVHGHAVTAWLRDSWPEANEEEWAYAALMAAADDAATLLADPTAEGERPRRVVVVAEVGRVTEDRESTAVTVDTAVALRLVVAVHADTEDVDPSIPEALGDLGWFAVQELPDLLA
ncbi:MAG: hypothetical protein ABWX73_11480 [Marmoricola sp.]